VFINIFTVYSQNSGKGPESKPGIEQYIPIGLSEGQVSE